MMNVTMILFERLGLLLVIAFVLTRIPGFRSLLDREFSRKMTVVHAFVFGLFGIAGTMTGIMMEDGDIVYRGIIWTGSDEQMVVSSSLVAMVIAGLLGGPVVGLGAGVIAGAHLFYLGGLDVLANSFVNPLTGLLAGWTAKFFSNERVISPMKALFIGVFPPILQMHLLLIFPSPKSADMLGMVDVIGLPLVLSNSVAIAIFTAMIGMALKEQENEAALATKRAFTIAEEALPYLRKDSPKEMASGLAQTLHERLRLAAVSVTNETEVLAHKGVGDDHHKVGDRAVTSLSHKALDTRQIQVAYSREEIQCRHQHCPFEAAIIIPMEDANESPGLIKFFFRKAQHIRPAELMLAQGLEQLIANQMNAIATEKLKAHIRDAELRNLQAQINPHFLFNTLHLIAALFRKDPAKARHITVQLAQYMRFNIELVSSSLVPLKKECEHVKAYIDIVKTRFSSQLTIDFTIADAISGVSIPPSTIQPLVENCIQHGLENVTDGGEISVIIGNIGNSIQISVRDNGRGFPDHVLQHAVTPPLRDQQDGGAGLYNVNQRLISLLGESARLHIRNLPDVGSEVFFSIPTKP